MNQLGFCLLPEKKIEDLYQPIINDLARKLKTPKFEPHITLVSAVSLKNEAKSILETVAKVIKNIQPIPIELSEVSLSTTYFQCVFARVKPNLELLQAHQLIKSTLRHSDTGIFTPHMSLIYGNLDLARRLEIAKTIKLPARKFIADRINVITADGLDQKTWSQIAEFRLET